MTTNLFVPTRASHARRIGQRPSCACSVWLIVLALLFALAVSRAVAQTQDVAYANYRDPKGPFSIHVVRVPRDRSRFEIITAHAGGRALGLASLSEMATQSRSGTGTAVAAINGDFYNRGGTFAGDPRGLQVINGELMSAPKGTPSFWIDAVGEPHLAPTISQLHVQWPDGSTSRIGLNGSRRPNGLELYTPAVGASTRTGGGRELVLEQPNDKPRQLLGPGKSIPMRVREVRETGNTRILPGTFVLSLGPSVARAKPALTAGAELVISTETSPSLEGASAAISGGPILVHEGRRQSLRTPDEDSEESGSMFERHPRSAVGWNDTFFFLVEVDGRQRASVGMTLSELSSYLVKLGCQEAMNLDGGGSATLWYNGAVKNRPCEGDERPIANALMVLKKKAEANQAPPLVPSAKEP